VLKGQEKHSAHWVALSLVSVLMFTLSLVSVLMFTELQIVNMMIYYNKPGVSEESQPVKIVVSP